MVLASFQSLETEFFRGLNQLVEPLVRAGFGAPLLSPVGMIVVEMQGRQTGKRSNVPLMAAAFGDLVVVSTVRRRSNWLMNLEAHPDIRYWLGSRELEATAFAIGPGIESPRTDPPARIACLIEALKQHSRLFGTGFAILAPRASSAELP